MSQEQIDIREIQIELAKIVDPEIGVPIAEMNLIDKLEVKDGVVEIEYHATTPYCPPIFALHISKSIKENVMKVKGVKGVKVRVTGHYLAEAINRQVDQLFSNQKKDEGS
jgi:metal-sulfur cluster biosynthetic enzyme